MYFLFFLIVVGGLAPSLIWWGILLTQDSHPEKKGNLIRAFVYGILSAVPVLIFVFAFREGINLISWNPSTVLRTFITGALAEEVVKGVVLYLFIFHKRYFNEPIDAFIYGITIALGFAAIENIVFIIGEVSGAFPTPQIIILLAVRFVTAIVIHVVSTAFIAYGLYIGSYVGRIYGATASFILGILIHGVYNLLLEQTQHGGAFIIGYSIILGGGGYLLFRRVRYLQNHSWTTTHLDE